MLFFTVLYVANSVGDCGWPIPAWDVLMDVAFWKFSNNPPNYDSVSDAMTFFIVLHSTCTGTFFEVIYGIGVFDFGPSKNIYLLCFMPPVLICTMHTNICGYSFCFFFILLFCLDVLRCNLIRELSCLRFLLGFFLY